MRTRLIGMTVALLCASTLALAQVKTETEPNNTRAQAQEVRIGDAIEGTIQVSNDTDWFKLVIDKPGKNEIQIDLGTTPGLEARFVIQDKDGKELWTSNPARKGETESVAHFVVTEGVYFIRIDGRGQSPADKYTLSTPVHKFGNVFRYAAGRRATGAASSLSSKALRSALVNRQSNGVAMDS